MARNSMESVLKYAGVAAVLVIVMAVAFLLLPPTEAQAAGCTVTYDDGTTYTDTGTTDNKITACTDYYLDTHPCSVSTDRPEACKAQDMYYAINWGAKVNLIQNVKKGLWSVDIYSKDGKTVNNNVTRDVDTCVFKATPGKRSPNSIRALIEAWKAGWKSVELDTQLVWPSVLYGQDKSDAWELYSVTMIGHAEDYWAFTSYDGLAQADVWHMGYVWNMYKDAVKKLFPLYMLSLDLKTVGTKKIDEWIPAVEVPAALVAADSEYEGMLVLFDPKAPRNPQPNLTYMNKSGGDNTYQAKYSGPIIDGVGKNGCYPEGSDECNEGQLRQQLSEMTTAFAKLDAKKKAMVGLKSVLPFDTIKKNIPTWQQFSWVPMAPNEKKTGEAGEYLKFIDDWMTGAGKAVLFLDINTAGPDWWQDHSFDWDGTTFKAGGTTYVDVTDYIRKKYNRRGQWWSPLAQTSVGTIGKYATDAQLKPNLVPKNNSPKSRDYSFMAPDPAMHMIEKNAAWAVVTHDRPDIFLQIRNRAKGADEKGKTGFGCDWKY